MHNKHNLPLKKARFTSAFGKSPKLSWQGVSNGHTASPASNPTANLEHEFAGLDARVTKLEASICAVAAKYAENPNGLLTITEFCQRTRMKRTTFFALKKARQGPRETRIGGKIFITMQAETDWLRSNEVPSGFAKLVRS